jgi:hypothetical protein
MIFVATQFRVGWQLVPRERAGESAVVWTPSSLPVRTAPGGRPGSAPVITSAAAVDATSKLWIAWRPPLQPNGEIIAYSISVQARSGHQEAAMIKARIWFYCFFFLILVFFFLLDSIGEYKVFLMELAMSFQTLHSTFFL